MNSRIKSSINEFIHIHLKSFLTYFPECRKASWQWQMHVSVAESTFNSLFEGLHNVDFCCHTQDSNGRFPRLGNIEQIVE